MRTNNKDGTGQNDKGEGHKAKIAVIAHAKIEIDGKVTEFKVDYDVSVTIEHLDYVVREIAGGIAQAAGDIAKNGIRGKRAESVSV